MTLRMLGCPEDRKTITWYRSYMEHGETAFADRLQGRYTEAQKQAAVNHYLSSTDDATVSRYERLAIHVAICSGVGFMNGFQISERRLVKAAEIVRKDPGINPRDLTNREKTLLIDALRDIYRLTELREALVLPRSSYFYHRAR